MEETQKILKKLAAAGLFHPDGFNEQIQDDFLEDLKPFSSVTENDISILEAENTKETQKDQK